MSGAPKSLASPQQTGPSSTCPHTTTSGGRRRAQASAAHQKETITSGHNVDPTALATVYGRRLSHSAPPGRRGAMTETSFAAARPSARFASRFWIPPSAGGKSTVSSRIRIEVLLAPELQPEDVPDRLGRRR